MFTRTIPMTHAGEVYGLWTTKTQETVRATDNERVVWCQCYCGVTREVLVRQLHSGISTSCGCGAVYYSNRAMDELSEAWHSIPAYKRMWNNYEQFVRWSLSRGFKLGAQLKVSNIYVDPVYGEHNCYWSPSRAPKAPRTKRGERFNVT